MLKPRHWSRAGIFSLSAAKEERSKLLHSASLHYAIFSNHYRRLFLCRHNPYSKTYWKKRDKKAWIRHFATKDANEKHGIILKSIYRNHAQRPVGHGQGMDG
jgi:hypothetical protein